MRNNQQGFTLPEAFLGLFLMAGVGIAGLQLSKGMKDASTTVTSSSDLTRTMVEIRTLVRDPEVCAMNFINAGEDSVINKIKDRINDSAVTEAGTNTESPQVAPKIEHRDFSKNALVSKGNYKITNMRVTKLDALRNRAYLTVDFDRTNDGRSTISSISKSVSLFVRIANGKISECIDPVTLSSDAILDKLCYEADPLNYDADLANDNQNCADNLANLIGEMKKIYCENHPQLRYAGGKCRPLAAGTDCGPGYFLQGFDVNGDPICYTPPPQSVPASPPVCNDTTWTLTDLPENVCNTSYIDHISNCGSTGTSTTLGTMVCTSPQCTGGARTWGPMNICSGTLADTGSGTKIVSNLADGVDGSVKYTCNAGTWSLPFEEVCLKRCAAGTLNWPSATECSANVLETASSSVALTRANQKPGFDGSADWVCNNDGNWVLQPNATCDVVVPVTGTTRTRTGTTCFVAGTKVMMGDGSEKNIENILKGDLVKTFNEVENAVSVNKVIEPLPHGLQTQILYTFHFSNGRNFIVTDNHPIYLVDLNRWSPAWVIAESWLRGENPKLMNSRQEVITISLVGKHSERIKTYNMHVQRNHNYYASDILVHNIKAREPVGVQPAIN